MGSFHGGLHDAVRPREAVRVLAPNGTFTFTGEEDESIVLIGGGVGITPLMSVTRYLTESQWRGNVHLILELPRPERLPVPRRDRRASNCATTV